MPSQAKRQLEPANQERLDLTEDEVELMWLEQQLARRTRELEELQREEKELEDELGDQRLDIEGNGLIPITSFQPNGHR
jgi:hypothetical protein